MKTKANNPEELMEWIAAGAKSKGVAPVAAPTTCYTPPRSPIEMMIDAATGYCEPTEPPKPTKEQREIAEHLAADVMSDLRYYYPDVVKTRPTTWPLHLKNTITAKAATMLAEYNAAGEPQPPKTKKETNGN